VGHAPWGRFWPGVLPGAGGRAAGSDGCSSPAEASGAAADPNHHEPYSPLHQHPDSALVFGIIICCRAPGHFGLPRPQHHQGPEED
jgi:hypothetical protein